MWMPIAYATMRLPCTRLRAWHHGDPLHVGSSRQNMSGGQEGWCQVCKPWSRQAWGVWFGWWGLRWGR